MEGLVPLAAFKKSVTFYIAPYAFTPKVSKKGKETQKNSGRNANSSTKATNEIPVYIQYLFVVSFVLVILVKLSCKHMKNDQFNETLNCL